MHVKIVHFFTTEKCTTIILLCFNFFALQKTNVFNGMNTNNYVECNKKKKSLNKISRLKTCRLCYLILSI